MPKYKRKKKKITDKCTGANGVWTAGENESGSFNSYSYVYVYIYTARTTQCICFFPSIFNILCIFSIDIAFHCLVYYCKISRFFSLRSRIRWINRFLFFHFFGGCSNFTALYCLQSLLPLQKASIQNEKKKDRKRKKNEKKLFCANKKRFCALRFRWHFGIFWRLQEIITHQ